jgi:AbrB family looped-hinge helix DNA binding protein
MDISIFDAIIPSMKTTITLDKAGRIVIPKRVREKMRLREGSRLALELVGDHIELKHEANQAQIEKRGKRSVIVGWQGLDAVEATREAREEYLDRLAGERRED